MTLLITGSGLFIAGFTYLLPKIGQIEIPLMIRFQSLVNKRPWIGIFQEIWFLGRTVFSVIFLAALISYDWTLGSTASLIFLALVGFETLLKRVVNRIRPFNSSPEVLMLQPAEPGDASFPSGDALGIWFLALVLAIAAGSAAFFRSGPDPDRPPGFPGQGCDGRSPLYGYSVRSGVGNPGGRSSWLGLALFQSDIKLIV